LLTFSLGHEGILARQDSHGYGVNNPRLVQKTNYRRKQAKEHKNLLNFLSADPVNTIDMLANLTNSGLPHFAYLDGGSGSMVLQIAIAGLLSASYVIKARWQSLKAHFSKKPSTRQDV
jgi:hypothetical protein